VGHKQNENPMKIRRVDLLSPRQMVGWPTYSAIALWLVAVAVSYCAISRYQFGTIDPPTAVYAKSWPGASRLPLEANHSTLVLFMHPRCPCTRATLAELERLFASLSESAEGTIEFVVDVTVPEDAGAEWLETDSLKRAKTIANANVFIDRGGVEAAAFGATTSGFVMLFDEHGTRQYAGGVTESRGHEGDNAGRENLARVLNYKIEPVKEIPAFGCRLCLPENERPTTTATQIGAT
jgi:hypothetical protein